MSTDSSPARKSWPAWSIKSGPVRRHAIFLEIGSNPQLAQQVSGETGVKVVTDIYTHSITPPDGPAPTYIDMMKANVNAIVQALR